MDSDPFPRSSLARGVSLGVLLSLPAWIGPPALWRLCDLPPLQALLWGLLGWIAALALGFALWILRERFRADRP